MPRTPAIAPKAPKPRGPLVGYLHNTLRPLHSLVFLSPLILAYELGLMAYGTDQIGLVARDIYARRLLYDFLEWFGISGYYLPGLVVVVVLLSMHVVRRDVWRLEPRLYGYMGVESLLLAMPLFVFSLVFFRVEAAQVVAGGAAGGLEAAAGWPSRLVFSFGAGIYEELLFRLIALAALHALLVDFLRLSDNWGIGLSVAVSAALFGIYHFSAQNPFGWEKFFFYALAGVYFAALYLARGFGIAAGTHALYDVLVVLFQTIHEG